eukprot:TRINITY_DN2867_c0_g1_i1.p1 TRINITY_DN2867_c0_g1~~TRINITY_DN2867_c0_g1_i1.p1  ORF type:complete len:649 (+),score=168.30 TRINITY_DN2867_c0_g1_i1:126-2072(+)
MNFHPRHCHRPELHRHKSPHEGEPINMTLWSVKNSIQVYEYAPIKRTNSKDISSQIYFNSPGIAHAKARVDSPLPQRSKSLINHESMERLTTRLGNSAAGKQWAKVGIRHHIGACVPVFSLRSEQFGGQGVGGYLDLLPLVDWCSANGMDVIQLLPINDTNPFDNSPFCPISSFSLNPKLISLRGLPNYDKQNDKMKEVIKGLEELDKGDRVQWGKVIELKREWLFEYFMQPEQQETLKGSEFKTFLDENRSWLEGYGLFCLLKNKHEWKHWEEWEEQIPADFDPSKRAVTDLDFAKNLMEDSENRSEVEYHMYLQFLCSQQMKRVKEYAESKAVFIKGDIPFLVSADSVDVWLNRSLFNLEKTAGAPPDMFSADGQNWGVPCYNWDASRKTNFTWWKLRLQTANRYYHLFRIDHVVGFFRVWAIPRGKKGSEGSFEPSEPAKFIEQGEEVMKVLLANCDMLPIGEDLGTVPPEVRVSLQRLGICGTKVVRWERKWEEAEQPFIPFEDYNADSMTTMSTHDSETLEQWWRNQPSEVEAYCKATGLKMKESEDAPLTPDERQQMLTNSVTSPSLFHINLLPEYLALEPSLIHADPADERINLPGQVLDSNWSYRMVPKMEDVSNNEQLTERMKSIVSARKQVPQNVPSK